MAGRILWQISKIGSTLSLTKAPQLELMDARAQRDWAHMTTVLRELTKAGFSSPVTVASSDQFYQALKKNIEASIDASVAAEPVENTASADATASENASLDSVWSELTLPLPSTFDPSYPQR